VCSDSQTVGSETRSAISTSLCFVVSIQVGNLSIYFSVTTGKTIEVFPKEQACVFRDLGKYPMRRQSTKRKPYITHASPSVSLYLSLMHT
jgi:hypothetical protein